MFVKSRCLFIVSEEIKSSLNHGALIEKIIYKFNLYNSFFRNASKSDNIKNALSMLPCGTIFSESLSKKGEELKYYISLPMFSSHFNLPVKEGEFIWIYPYKEFDDSVNSNYYNIINSYWMSRVHSFFHTEDTNYNFNDRDYNVNASIEKYNNYSVSRKNNKTVSERKEIKEKNKKLENTVLRQYTTRSDFFNNKVLKSKLLIDDRRNYFNIKNTPRYFSKREDFTIQGSNSTLINLGSNLTDSSTNKDSSGEISIVTGIGYLFKKGNDFSKKSFKTRNSNHELNDKLTKVGLYEDSNFSHSILNDRDQEENFKLPNISISDDTNNITRNINEGNLNIIYDASTIKITEENKSKIYIGSFYNSNNNIQQIDFNDLTADLDESINDIQLYLNLEKPSLSNKVIKRANVKSKSKHNSLNKPQIGLVSSNICLYSRNSNEIVKNESGGSIKLIKDSMNNENYSEISMQPDGNIILTGKKIIIGDYSREINKKNGMGSSLILGVNGELNPSVLGNKLVSLLTELIEINKEALTLISLALSETSNNFNLINSNLDMIKNWANLHNHSHPNGPTTGLLPGSSMTKPEFSTMENIDNSSNENGVSEVERLTDLVKNIDKILSKFVQTS